MKRNAYIHILMLRWLIVVACIFFLYSCQRDIQDTISPGATHQVNIRFVAAFGSDSLQFGEQYVNSFEEDVSFSAFKVYIHGISFLNTSTGKSELLTGDDYHLLDLSNPSVNVIQGMIPSGSYDEISFVIGVDSALNVSGAQAGVLDPLNGMFWTWNSGYIMAKLEGHSTLAATPNNVFQYHIGGFRTGENVVKRISLSFPSGELLTAAAEKETQMVIRADAESWFSGNSFISIEEHPVCMTPGNLAMQIAGNYYQMFSVSSLIDQP